MPRYQSLHRYVETETLDAFLSQISDEDGRGYERWRYTLIDDTPPPRDQPGGIAGNLGSERSDRGRADLGEPADADARRRTSTGPL